MDDDANPEMPQGGMVQGTANRAGVDPSDPARVRIVYEFQGREYESELLPPGTDPERSMDAIIRRVIVPVTAVRAYRGDHELIDEWNVRMRGT